MEVVTWLSLEIYGIFFFIILGTGFIVGMYFLLRKASKKTVFWVSLILNWQFIFKGDIP